MIISAVTTVLVGALSALVPAVPIEPYLVGLVLAGSPHPVLLGVAAALGQTAGKLGIFLAVRGAVRWAWARRWLTGAVGRLRRRRPAVRRSAIVARISTLAGQLLGRLDRAAWAVPVVLLSAVTGVPPLLATSIYAARTRISGRMFLVACLLGRSIRFVAIASAPQLFGYEG